MMNAQKRLQQLLESLIDRGWELGAQLAVYQNGELAVDVAVGRFASSGDRRVDSDTLFPVCSTGKGILATIVHRLAGRGVIDYDRPIAEYWPEFGVNGKSMITVRHALSHQAGMPPNPEFRSFAEASDFDAACARVAESAPIAVPGASMHYHSRSFGWIVGGLVRKAAGRPLKQLLLEEVTQPLGITDSLFFGISEEADARFSAFEPQPIGKEQCSTAPTTHAPPPSGMPKELALPLMDFVNLPSVRRCSMPAVNGIMSAKAIAKHYAALMGEVNGVRLIPAKRLELATTRQTQPGATPECFGHGFGLGYCLKGPASDMGAFFGHGGAGGSEGMANQRLKLAIGLTKNRMDKHQDAPDHTVRIVMREIAAIFGTEGDGGFYQDVCK